MDHVLFRTSRILILSFFFLLSVGCSLDASLVAEKASQLIENLTPDSGTEIFPTVTFDTPSRLTVNVDNYVGMELQFENADIIEIDQSDIVVNGGAATCEVYFDDSEGYYVELYNCTGNGVVSVGVAPGVARSNDGKSSVQTTSPFLITVDNIAPVIEITSPVAGSSVADTNSFIVSGSCDETGTDIYLNYPTNNTVACSGGVWSADLVVASSGTGNISVSVYYEDSAGNFVSDARSFVIPVKVYKVVDIFNSRRTSGVLLGDGSFVPWGWNTAVTNMSVATQNAVKSGISAVLAPNYEDAFTVLKSSGTLVNWGSSRAVSDVTSAQHMVSMVSNEEAFSGLRSNGTVFGWGYFHSGGNPPTSVTSANSGVHKLIAARDSVLALKANGTAAVWGGYSDESSVPVAISSPGSGVIAAAGKRNAWSAMRVDGSIYHWGSTAYGADAVAPPGVIELICANNEGGFAGRKADGSVITWGKATAGGDPSAFLAQLQKNRKIVCAGSIFVTLSSSGAVFVWGGYTPFSASPPELASGVSDIFVARNRVFAYKSNGAVYSISSGTGAATELAAADGVGLETTSAGGLCGS